MIKILVIFCAFIGAVPLCFSQNVVEKNRAIIEEFGKLSPEEKAEKVGALRSGLESEDIAEQRACRYKLLVLGDVAEIDVTLNQVGKVDDFYKQNVLFDLSSAAPLKAIPKLIKDLNSQESPVVTQKGEFSYLSPSWAKVTAILRIIVNSPEVTPDLRKWAKLGRPIPTNDVQQVTCSSH